ncbi:hypothetical protein GDO78_019951 [Eleutherodactylus coqui]|uniref:Uncharacterized protein n=1 Tax=Eleutherodactylus coqui TaxID=57060 RepID=A0A8J6E606_ELECQ|nr:hypothetical protein GDO78_019951 [Eleutherodactylus coqui]
MLQNNQLRSSLQHPQHLQRLRDQDHPSPQGAPAVILPFLRLATIPTVGYNTFVPSRGLIGLKTSDIEAVDGKQCTSPIVISDTDDDDDCTRIPTTHITADLLVTSRTAFFMKLPQRHLHTSQTSRGPNRS